MSERIRHLSNAATHAAGSARGLMVVAALSLAWGIVTATGHASDRAQILVNLLLSILTLLLAMLIQASQNRDGAAVHAKLGELLVAVEGARNEVSEIDQATEAEIAALREEQRAREKEE